MSGPLANLDYPLLALFTVGAFVAVSAVVLISAHIKVRRGSRLGVLRLLSLAGAAAAALLLIVALSLASGGLPLTVVIIAAGLAVLWAPWLADLLPERLRDSKGGLALSIVVCAVTAALLHPSLFAI